jgi:hypothetical protein
MDLRSTKVGQQGATKDQIFRQLRTNEPSQNQFYLPKRAIIYSLLNFLPAAKIPLRCLNGRIPEQKLDLLQVATGPLAQFRA